MNNVHPIIAIALMPAMPVTRRLQYGNVNYLSEQHMREDIERDRKALQQQMRSENSRTNFGETA